MPPAAGRRNEAEPRFGQADLRFDGGDAKVTGECKLEPAPHGGAADFRQSDPFDPFNTDSEVAIWA